MMVRCPRLHLPLDPDAKPSNTSTMVCLDKLDPDRKRRIWSAIKKHDPALAALLTSPEMALIKTTFGGGRVYLDEAAVRAAIKPR